MNGAIHPAASHQGIIRGIHNGVHLHFCYIISGDFERHDDSSSFFGHDPGSTVLNVRTDDIAQMIVAYDHEMERRDAVATSAIHECNAEAVALDIALTTARALADDIINGEKIEIRADQAGASRIQYTIQLVDKPFVETEFWASMSEFKPRLLRAIRNLHHKERELYL